MTLNAKLKVPQNINVNAMTVIQEIFVKSQSPVIWNLFAQKTQFHVAVKKTVNRFVNVNLDGQGNFVILPKATVTVLLYAAVEYAQLLTVTPRVIVQIYRPSLMVSFAKKITPVLIY